jgi:hypothetical protein
LIVAQDADCRRPLRHSHTNVERDHYLIIRRNVMVQVEI